MAAADRGGRRKWLSGNGLAHLPTCLPYPRVATCPAECISIYHLYRDIEEKVGRLAKVLSGKKLYEPTHIGKVAGGWQVGSKKNRRPLNFSLAMSFKLSYDVFMTKFTLYRLPDNQIVQVDSTAAKGELLIGFTLADGTIVTAIHVL